MWALGWTLVSRIDADLLAGGDLDMAFDQALPQVERVADPEFGFLVLDGLREISYESEVRGSRQTIMDKIYEITRESSRFDESEWLQR